jgi:F0F1-type ATP synthase beta subunit
MPTTSNLVCVPCGTFMRVAKNGVTVEEQMEDGSPYKLWDADKYKCPACGHEVMSGFGREPLAEHYQPTYQAHRAAFAAREPIIEAK